MCREQDAVWAEYLPGISPVQKKRSANIADMDYVVWCQIQREQPGVFTASQKQDKASSWCKW